MTVAPAIKKGHAETCAPSVRKEGGQAAARSSGRNSRGPVRGPSVGEGRGAVCRSRSERSGGEGAGSSVGGALRFSGFVGPLDGTRAEALGCRTCLEAGPRVAGGTVTVPSWAKPGKRAARAAGRVTWRGMARSVRWPARRALARSPVRFPGRARAGAALACAAGVRVGRIVEVWTEHRYHGDLQGQSHMRTWGRW